MKRILATLSSLFFVIACGEDSTSAFNAWSENSSSSSTNVLFSSSSTLIEDLSSSSSCHSGPDTESSSSQKNKSSSSVKQSSSSSAISTTSSSSTEPALSSAERIEDLSSSSRHSGSDPESSSIAVSSSSIKLSSSTEVSSSSSMDSISSSSLQNDKSSSSVVVSSSSIKLSSSSVILSSSSKELSSSSVAESSSSVVVSSSSEILTDPSKIFEIRKPKGHVLPCEVPRGGEGEFMRDTLSQHDVICTYDYNGEKGFLYVQLTPISCGGGMSITPGRYNVDKAEFYVNGKFADVSDVDYEWGSNHHVEKLWFTYKENVFLYSQSTMGWGGRPCQNMDCLKVFESDGKTYVENGCNERSLPIVCRNINSKGEVVSDFTDTYKVCEGDPRTLGYDVEY